MTLPEEGSHVGGHPKGMYINVDMKESGWVPMVKVVKTLSGGVAGMANPVSYATLRP